MPQAAHRRQTLRQYLLASPTRLPVLLLAACIVYGTVGYVVIEGYSPLNGLYMTVTTLTTVGFGEIEPLGPAGRLFTLSLVAIGFTAVFTLLAVLTSLVVSGQLGRSLTRRGMRHQIDALSDHYVVCAFGRVGRAAVEELVEEGASVVVVEVDPAREPDLLEVGVLYILDDPTREDVLEQAGIKRAKGLLCAVDSDATNVYITLLARARNPDLFIIGREARPMMNRSGLLARASKVM
jgi:voltage-gated potassium channel